MADSVFHGEQAVIEADVGGDAVLRSEALMSLAGSMALAGENLRALEILDEASASAGRRVWAEIQSQRGAVLSRMGEMNLALRAYSSALPLLHDDGNRQWVANVLHNRGMTRLALGQLAKADTDFARARELYVLEGSLSDVAGANHGLGLVAYLRGDLPLALALLDESSHQYTELLGSASESQVSRCDVLLSAGLLREALALAGVIVKDMKRSGLAEDEAEAHLAGAQAALLAGYLDDAVRWATRAEEMFAGQGRPTWAANARLIAIEAQSQLGDMLPDLVDEARRVAATLEERGHSLSAFRARFLSGSIAQRLGRLREARQELGQVAGRSFGPIEIRLQARLARARLRLMERDLRGADAAARAGLDLLDGYQAALGATDIRLGVERHARELADLGLRLAIQSGRARRVFAWMERSKGTALTHRPVAPPPDPELAAELAVLRQVAGELRTATDDVAVGLLRRERQLQESIRSRARRTEGEERTTVRIDPTTLAAHLRNRTLVEFASIDGALWSVVVDNGRYRVRKIGSEAEITAELNSLRFLMRRLARGRGSPDTVVEVARRLDERLFAGVWLAGPLVIVPTADLHVTPWWALPTCKARPLTISPSAKLWFRAGRQPTAGDRVLAAAGPDLELSDEEVIEVGALYQTSTVLLSGASDAESVQAQMDGAATVHIASHAFFQYENPMFSSLRLADGDLYVYDIERLRSAPGLVVLSACDSGFTETHPGEELMGLSSALLSMGTKTIIASVGLVPDSAATKDLMVALHRGLVSGLSPSHALHQAQTEAAETPEGYVAASSFICIGAG
jgi:tetratricopeptide (TPR) repeat protein